MKKSRRSRVRLPIGIIALALLCAHLLSGCSPAPPSPVSGPAAVPEQAALQLTVVAQQGQIGALRDQVAELQTAVALRPTAAPAPRPPSIPTVGAAVQGLRVDGLSKGLASAKVVLDEYSDFQ